MIIDGSGSSSDPENGNRWSEMETFCKALAKGFDDNTHIGLIRYGSQPAILVDMNGNATREVCALFINVIFIT